MTHYLRRGKDTVVDIETTNDDLMSVICIAAYSDMLLNEETRQLEMIQDFAFLQELRGEYFETPGQQESPKELVERRLKEVGDKYGLAYVTD